MKKLFMIAAVACMATFAQAMTLNWTAGYSNLGTTWTTNATVSLVWSSSTSSVEEVAFALSSGAIQPMQATTSGDIITDAQPPYVLTFVEDVETPETVLGTYFLVFANGDDYYVSTVDASATAGKWYDASPLETNPAVAGTDFTKVVVPEPTALALLALGVAGVALRRRRRA